MVPRRTWHILLIPPVFFSPRSRTIPRFTLIAIFAIITLNIVFGHPDQVLLFIRAMAAIGGYVTVMLADYLDDFLRDAAQYRSLVFGILLIVLFQYFRNGIVRWVSTRANRDGISSSLPAGQG